MLRRRPHPILSAWHNGTNFDYEALLISFDEDGGSVRIVAGLYRGRNLKSPPSMEIRPTSDRLRETLFNVLAPRIVDANFLDLCAGAGAIGIEALSRGAAFVTFVDKSRKMCGLVEANLDLCRVPEDETEVVLADVAEYLRRAGRSAQADVTIADAPPRYDFVFYDPPYALDYAPVLALFGAEESQLLTDDAMVIVEHHHKKPLPETVGQLRRWRVLKQGDSSLSFYEKG